ncbi:pilus assembly protein [Paenibacillus sp. URB8-2]|uniref:pilus assembly protein n=1 Tax=Paenibacillus sp. URB8-2 TaxID=2741301 RepID=UPI0015C0AAF3|nr:pilus assembly protein [Paenibacillus sp. URB8-2]BCG57722.1 hypothetical protein PUR_11470 [Paenibacillus sp. URB8-2]
MKKKGDYFALITLALATAAVIAWVSLSTTKKNASTPKSSAVESQSVDKTNPNLSSANTRSPKTVGKEIKDKASGDANVPNSFTVNANYGQLKLLLKNYSSYEVHVTLTHIVTRKVYFAKDIAGGGSLEWNSWTEGYTQGMRIGHYILEWSGRGYNVNAGVEGQLASSTKDF